MLHSLTDRRGEQLNGALNGDGLSPQQQLTIAIALRLLLDAWENEIDQAANEQRAPCLQARGSIFGIADILPPEELELLAIEFDQGVVAPEEERWTVLDWGKTVPAFSCVHCDVPMAFRESTVTDSSTGNVRRMPVLACPKCGDTAGSSRQAKAWKQKRRNRRAQGRLISNP